MNVSILPHLRQFIEDQIKAGRFDTPDEVVNSALSHLAAHIEFPPDEVEELKRELAVGIEQLERGEAEEWDPKGLWSEVERLHAEGSRSDDKKVG